MNPDMLDSFSARSMGVSLADYVLLQRLPAARPVRRRRIERRSAALTGRGPALRATDSPADGLL
ncbi:hypothetical protein PU560_02785 [Georgenia sp. 10Sc9-8]|uniref:DUF3263 domain-containing protein n=1 Tax=Georgenia halotolerans TaxID=3028317 RepID=A0ABT5TTW2_9MICO|nr:hypothetical protein [Georgenia halotolerans]